MGIYNNFSEFLGNFIKFGLEYFGMYYSIYEGTVVSNQDPEKRGRLKISCEKVYGKSIPEVWADPFGMAAVGVNSGFFDIPDIGDAIYLQFQNGKTDAPLWSPGWWGKKDGKNEVPWNCQVSEGYPDVATWRHKKGHRIECDLRDGHDRMLLIVPNGTYIDLDMANQSIEIYGVDNFKKQIALDSLTYIGGNDKENIDGNKQKTVGGNESIGITGNKSESIIGNSEIGITGNETKNITGNKQEAITGNKESSITGNKNESITGQWTLQTMQDINIQSTGNIILKTLLPTSQIQLNPIVAPPIIPLVPPVDPTAPTKINKPLQKEKV